MTVSRSACTFLVQFLCQLQASPRPMGDPPPNRLPKAPNFGRRLLAFWQQMTAIGPQAPRHVWQELCRLMLDTIRLQMWYLCTELPGIEDTDMYRQHYDQLTYEVDRLRGEVTNAELREAERRIRNWQKQFEKDSKAEGVIFPKRIKQIIDDFGHDSSQLPPKPYPAMPQRQPDSRGHDRQPSEGSSRAPQPSPGHRLRRSLSGWPTSHPSTEQDRASIPLPPPLPLSQHQRAAEELHRQQQFAAMQDQHRMAAVHEQQRLAARQDQRQIAAMQEQQRREHVKDSGAQGHKKNAFSLGLFGKESSFKLPSLKRNSSDRGSVHSSSTTGRSQTSSSSSQARSQLSPSPFGGAYGMNMPSPYYSGHAHTMIDLRPETYDHALAIDAQNQELQDMRRREGLAPGTSAGWPSLGRRQQPAPRQSIDEEDDEDDDDDDDDEEEESDSGKGKGPARYQGRRWDRYGGGGAAGGAAGFPGGQPGSGAPYAWRR